MGTEELFKQFAPVGKTLARKLLKPFVKSVVDKLTEDNDDTSHNTTAAPPVPCPVYTGGSLNWGRPETIVFPNGDTVPDFTKCGCDATVISNSELTIHPVITLNPTGDADRTCDIQNAINEIAKMPLNEYGFRGVLFLKAGSYHVHGSGFIINTGGIVIRGENGPNGPLTELVCHRAEKGILFHVKGPANKARDVPANRKQVVSRVPVGANIIPLTTIAGLSVGDMVKVVRVGNEAWIQTIGMHNIPKRPKAPPEATKNWTPFNLVYDRKIVAFDPVNNCVTIDAPITTAIDPVFGGGYVWKYDGSYRIQNVGIENISARCCLLPDTKWDCHKATGLQVCEDERHLEVFLQFDACFNCFARNCSATYFGFHTNIQLDALKVTIDRCSYLMPAGQITGGKRYGFTFLGQLSLVQYSVCDQARHAFAAGARMCGPNVFYRCKATNNFGCSETHHRWGNGLLYDECEANIAIQDRAWMGSGQGWSGANCFLWNTRGSVIVQAPPSAFNWAIGTQSKMTRGKASFPKPDHQETAFYVFLQDGQFPPSLLEHQYRLKK